MSGASQPALPNALEGDSDDIRWALETANAMWSQGDLREALRWIRRAAEAAAGEGLDLRAVELAKSAAALRTELDISPTMPPPAAEPAPPAAAPEPAPPAPPVENVAPPPAELDPTPADPPEAQAPARPPQSTEPGISPDGAVVMPPTAPVTYQSIRVAVMKAVDGRIEARLLRPGDPLDAGEKEAVLLALQPGADLLG